MIKTLRIAGIVVVILAGALLVFPVIFGVRGDKEIELFLSSAGAIERFKETAGSRANGKSQTSPLVKQAEAFASFLNPPVPVERPTELTPGIPRPPVISARFKLIGTSYFATHPELSLALIDEPGKGTHWVRQAAEVGHLLIEQIKDGSVVVKDGQKTFEIIMEKPEKRNPLIKDTSAAAAAPSPVLAAGGTQDVSGQRITDGSRDLFGDDIKKLDAIQAAVASEVPTAAELQELSEEEKRWADKLFSELEAMKVSAEEANRLGNLGQELKKNGKGKEDPNRFYRKVERTTRRSRRTESPR